MDLNTGANSFSDALGAQVAHASQFVADYSDLPAAILAQTSGTGVHATITFDPTAAGHSWFIDYTPYLNDEFLPTSYPNEWAARPGSGAYGRMDMLSVLLHEYGHALGIAHSADPNDFMATTLAPGVRRLPSAEEFALMARLAGELRVGLEGGGGDAPAPTDPATPGLPIGNGSVRSARARSRSIDAGTNSIESAQFEIAANPTLADPGLQTGAGWETRGTN